MKYDDESNANQSAADRWRKGLIVGFIFIFGFINSGCDNCDVCDNKDEILIDEYYVKYEVSSSTIYYGGKLNVTINTEKDNVLDITINTRTQWETVIGPVQKGFDSMLKVIKEGSEDSRLQLYTQISVSKNGDPFALKKIDGCDTPRNSVQINYKIDY